MTTHELKTWPEYFEAVFYGNKTFEIRRNDRDYKVFDTLVLREWDKEQEKYTGREVTVEVTYLARKPEFVKDGFVVLAIKPKSKETFNVPEMEAEYYLKKAIPLLEYFVRATEHNLHTPNCRVCGTQELLKTLEKRERERQ